MTGRIKFGVIGAVALTVLNACASFVIGFCGPLVLLLGGGVVGFLAARDEQPNTKGEGAVAGAIAGLIAGLGGALGQLVGGLASLTFFQIGDIELPFGSGPPPGDAGGAAAYYLGGALIGLCFGLVGIALASGAGAAAGYLGTRETGDMPPI